MTELPKASFWHRLLASILDSMIYFTLTALFLYHIASQPTLSQAVFTLMLFLVLLVANPLVYLQGILLTYYFGGTLGKIFSGLRVTNEKGHRLSMKRVAFRQTLGYQFSAILFGLGYFAILKDPHRQGWHDKTVGSVVIVERPIWIVGLLLLVGLGITTGFILSSTFTTIMTGPLSNEAQSLFVESMRKLDQGSPTVKEEGPYNLNFITPYPEEEVTY